MRDSAAQNSCRMMLSSLHLVGSDKNLFTLAALEKLTEWVISCICCSKEEKRLLRTRMTFSQSLTVADGMSKLGDTGLIFIDPGVKIDGTYYCNLLLSQQLLPAIHQSSSEFIFSARQYTVPASTPCLKKLCRCVFVKT